jgi:uncharacterized protein (DUF1684 family)
MRILLLISAIFCALLSNTSAANQLPVKTDTHQQDIKKWQQDRFNELKEEDSWLSVTGLFWLTEGVNGIGSEVDNKIGLPKGAPEYLGSYILKKNKITANFPPGSKVFHGDKPVTRLLIETDHQQKPTLLKYGTLIWTVIEREGRFGVRVKDLSLPQKKSLTDLGYFPTRVSWVVKSKFEAYKESKNLQVPTVMDWFWQATSPGRVTFTKNGQRHQLDIIDSGDEYFIIFGDTTNGKQTYGAGRFLYVDKPKAGGDIIIDFNKAHNPPCVFTPYATCPLPPPQNNLKLAVDAGEKNFHF